MGHITYNYERQTHRDFGKVTGWNEKKRKKKKKTKEQTLFWYINSKQATQITLLSPAASQCTLCSTKIKRPDFSCVPLRQ
jgi:hypothetical protein